jgi:hypothetical protein
MTKAKVRDDLISVGDLPPILKEEQEVYLPTNWLNKEFSVMPSEDIEDCPNGYNVRLSTEDGEVFRAYSIDFDYKDS